MRWNTTAFKLLGRGRLVGRIFIFGKSVLRPTIINVIKGGIVRRCFGVHATAAATSGNKPENRQCHRQPTKSAHNKSTSSDNVEKGAHLVKFSDPPRESLAEHMLRFETAFFLPVSANTAPTVAAEARDVQKTFSRCHGKRKATASVGVMASEKQLLQLIISELTAPLSTRAGDS